MSDPTQVGSPQPKRKNPLDALVAPDQGTSRAQTSGANPLDAIIGADQSSVAPTASGDVQLAEPMTMGDRMQQPTSPSELAALESQDIANNRQRLLELLQRPDLTPGQRARLQQLVNQMSVPTVGGIELTNRVTDPNRSDASNLARGVAAGAVNYGVLGALDLTMGAAQLAMPKFLENFIGLPQGRKALSDVQTLWREEMDPQGWWGTGGTAVGAVVGGLIPFGAMNSAALAALKGTRYIGPVVEGTILRGLQPGATFLQRLSANAVGAGAIDLTQLADILTDHESTWQQKATAIGTVVLMSGGAATLHSITPIKPKVVAAVDEVKPVTPPVDRVAEAAGMVGKAEAAQAAAARRLKINKLARNTWELQNPGKNWQNDLSKTDRAAWMKDFRERFDKENPPPASDTNLDTSTGDQLGLPLKPVEPGARGVGVEEKSGVSGEVPAEGVPAGESGKAPSVEPPVEEPPVAAKHEPEFEGDQRKLPRLGPTAEQRINAILELEAFNPTKFGPNKAKMTYEKLIPRHRLDLFGTNKDWAALTPTERTDIYKNLNARLDDFKALRAQKLVEQQMSRLERIQQGHRMVEEGRTTGDINKLHRGEEAIARNESNLPEGTDKDAVLTRIVDDLTQDMPKEMKTEVMLSIFRGEMPVNGMFAGDKAVAYLLRLGAKYDPRYSAPRTEPSLPKPEPSTPSTAEPTPPDTPPSPTTPPHVQSVEELAAENAQLRAENEKVIIERNEAIRNAEVDDVTGYGNKKAFERAWPVADADPNTDITFFDLTNFKLLNDKLGNKKADAVLKTYGEAIESAMRSMGLIGDGPKAAVRIFRQGDEFFVLHEVGRGDELIKTAIDLAGVLEIPQGKARYPVKLRGATAGRYEEVSLKMTKVKEGMDPSLVAPREVAKDAKPTYDFHGEKLKVPFEKLSRDKLIDLEDKFTEKLDAGEITPQEHAAIVGEITAELKSRVKGKAKPTKIGPEETPPDLSIRKATSKANTIGEGKKEPPLDPAVAMARAEKFRRTLKQPPEKLSDADLLAHRDDIDTRVREMGKIAANEAGYTERLAKLNEEVAKRGFRKGPPGGTVMMHPAVTGFAMGVAAGLVTPADPDQSWAEHMMYYTGTGLALGLGATAYMRGLHKQMKAAVPDYQNRIREHVKSVEDAPLERRVGVKTHLMTAYGAIARRDIGISNVSRVAGTRNMSAAHNAGKQAEIFGLWRGMSDRAIMGDAVGYWTNDGQFVKMDAMTLKQIAQLVGGDVRTAGDLAAAIREMTLRGLEFPRTTGIKLEDARLMYVNTPEKYHLAARELHKYFRALRDMSVQAGLLSKETAAKMDDQGFYVAIRRLFDGEPGTSSGTLDIKSKGGSKSTGPEDLFKHLKGSKLPFQNPYEAAIDLTPKIMRAIELNRLATTFFDEVRTLDYNERRLIASPVETPDMPKVTDAEKARISALKQTIADEGGPQLSDAEATAILASISDESLNVTSDKVRLYRDGKVEMWKVSDPVARAFRSLQPHELAAVMWGTGILTKPTNIARIGITANPVFVGWQAFRDIWQFHQNGTYAPPPDANVLTKVAGAVTGIPQSAFGSLRGWLGIMFHTGEYKKYLAAGAGGESVASQGLRIARGNIKHSTELLAKIREGAPRNQFEQIARELKSGSIREAYASMLQPIADAGRFGAYLQERGRGADVIEAIFRAKKAGANFGNRGQALAIQAANRMTLFLNPAIQSLDATRYAFQRDPVGYIARGIAGITIPSMMLWAAYNDDEEIKQLRSTEYGNKFWWFRVNGKIMKVPKPIFDGQVFGASAEAWLDHKMNQDPLAYKKWVQSMSNDATVNLLPFVGVVPISLMTNTNLGVGGKIVPPGTEGLDVEYRGAPGTSTLARLASQVTGPLARKMDTKFTDNLLSPAGYDYVVKQYLGGLGSELSRALSVAVDAQRNGGYMPPVEELPFIRSAFGNYPSLGVQAINEFYTYANRADVASQTATYLASASPDKVAQYLTDRMPDLILADVYARTRQNLTDLRKAIEDVRQAPSSIMSEADKRELTQLFLRQMVDIARNTNEVARSIRNTNER